MKKIIIICITILILGIIGIFWTYNLANVNVITKIEMDTNTMEWLKENNYCMLGINQPFDSDTNKPDITFIGECEYLNYSITAIKIE